MKNPIRLADDVIGVVICAMIFASIAGLLAIHYFG